MDRLLYFLLIASGEDKGDAADNDKNETKKKRHYERKCYERCNDLHDIAVLKKVAEHESGREVKGATRHRVP